MTSPPRSKRRRRRAEVEATSTAILRYRSQRGFGLSFWTALLAGAWLGRASVALPGGLDEAFDLLLPMAAAGIRLSQLSALDPRKARCFDSRPRAGGAAERPVGLRLRRNQVAPSSTGATTGA